MNMYGLLNPAEKALMEGGKEKMPLFIKLETFLGTDLNVLTYAVSPDPDKEQPAKSLFAKVKERIPDNSLAEEEAAAIYEVNENMPEIDRFWPGRAMSGKEVLTLTRKQVQILCQDRREHIVAERGQGR